MSQPEFIKVLGDDVKQQSLSNWETGRREPDLLVLLRYSEVANVCLDVLVDDEFELPATLLAALDQSPDSRGLTSQSLRGRSSSL
jgi:hypothetical protein